MKQFCIVIPIYSEHLNCIDKISLNQLKYIIGEKNYDIYFIHPNGDFNMKEYYDILSSVKLNINEKIFDKKYFESTKTYSHLCVSYDFYNSFSEYEYMLIYQLDCYLLKDEISSWCNKGYDYVGPPILSQHCGWPNTPRVGNGGFSLRKIETFKELTDLNGELLNEFTNIKDLIVKDKIDFEDLFFCVTYFDYYDLYMPNVKEAFLFGVDMNPDLIFDHLHYDWPLGLHSIDKNIRYYKYHIPDDFNNKEVIDYCENKNKDFFKLYYQDYKYSTIEK